MHESNSQDDMRCMMVAMIASFWSPAQARDCTQHRHLTRHEWTLIGTPGRPNAAQG